MHTDEQTVARAQGLREEALGHLATLKSGSLPYTGWVDLPRQDHEFVLRQIEKMAEEIQNKCSCLVVIGIGGSYLGAKAAIDFIAEGGPSRRGIPGGHVGWLGTPGVVFAGWNLSATWHFKVLDILKTESVCLLYISKSGNTVEPSVAFDIFREMLIERHGEEEANKRIYAITDAQSGSLREEANKNGWQTLVIPADVGGRYSVLTPVGLLPMAVAGVNIREVLKGAAMACEQDDFIEGAVQLACLRRSLQLSGKTAEIFEWYEPQLDSLAGWCQQLFGESEGKDGQGMLPLSMGLTRDLHSLGQFLQEGTQNFSEVLFDVAEPARDMTAGGTSPLLAGHSMNEIGRAARDGTIKAHRSVGIPVTVITVPDVTPSSFGMLVYMLELTCGLTGLLMGVNPFDQPGVEAYKKEMQDILLSV
jgi:glucose-6-phosphate isomerase